TDEHDAAAFFRGDKARGRECDEPAHAVSHEMQPIATRRRAVLQQSLRILLKRESHAGVGINVYRIAAALQAALHEYHRHTMHPQPMNQKHRLTPRHIFVRRSYTLASEKRVTSSSER